MSPHSEPSPHTSFTPDAYTHTNLAFSLHKATTALFFSITLALASDVCDGIRVCTRGVIYTMEKMERKKRKGIKSYVFLYALRATIVRDGAGFVTDNVWEP